MGLATNGMLPKCTGIASAWAIIFPKLSNIAQLKSALSFILGLYAVFRKT